jgi:hydroxypyruvate isomerase
MTLRYSANLSMLWADVPPIERFAEAALAGFDHVEMLFPGEIGQCDLTEALKRNRLQMALFDVYAGDWANGERGIAALPDRVTECRKRWPADVELARILETEVLTVLAGIRPAQTVDAYDATLIENLTYLSDLVSGEGITIAVEAINNHDIPGFHLRTIDHAATIVDAVSRENVVVQFDQYHVCRENDDPNTLIEEHIDAVGHVQVAEAPDRSEPGSGSNQALGFLARLDALGYGGRVGLEYKPSRSTTASLDWLPFSARSG